MDQKNHQDKQHNLYPHLGWTMYANYYDRNSMTPTQTIPNTKTISEWRTLKINCAGSIVPSPGPAITHLFSIRVSNQFPTQRLQTVGQRQVSMTSPNPWHCCQANSRYRIQTEVTRPNCDNRFFPHYNQEGMAHSWGSPCVLLPRAVQVTPISNILPPTWTSKNQKPSYL